MRHSPPVANVHLGIRELYPTLVESAVPLLRAEMEQHASVHISNQDFKRDVRITIQDLALRKNPDMPYAHYSHLPYVPEATSKVSLSYHGSLEGPNRREAVPGDYTKEFSPVLAGLSEFFEDAILQLHLVVTCQHDYSPIVDRDDRTSAIVSWADVAARMLETAPAATLTVWALEDPLEHCIPFILAVLGMRDLTLPDATRNRLVDLARRQRFARPKMPLDQIDTKLSVYLDELYEKDLSRLQRMEQVTVIGAR